jgi:hypothetical protein
LSQFNTVEERVEFLDKTRKELRKFNNFVMEYADVPMAYVDIFEAACLELPAVLRNSPFFSVPNR